MEPIRVHGSCAVWWQAGSVRMNYFGGCAVAAVRIGATSRASAARAQPLRDYQPQRGRQPLIILGCAPQVQAGEYNP